MLRRYGASAGARRTYDRIMEDPAMTSRLRAARQTDSAINGHGERTGCVPTESTPA